MKSYFDTKIFNKFKYGIEIKKYLLILHIILHKFTTNKCSILCLFFIVSIMYLKILRLFELESISNLKISAFFASNNATKNTDFQLKMIKNSVDWWSRASFFPPMTSLESALRKNAADNYDQLAIHLVRTLREAQPVSGPCLL